MHKTYKTDATNEGGFQSIKAKPVTLKDDYKFFNRNIFFVCISFIIVGFCKLIFNWLYAPIFMGYRVKGRKNYRKIKNDGFVIVSNHIHNLDVFLIGASIYPKKVYVLMLESNLGLPFWGRVMRLAGGVPIPTKTSQFVTLMRDIPKQIQKNRCLVILPETALKLYHDGIRAFSKGAFRIALNANCDILPVVFTFRKRKGIRRLFSKKPLIQMNYLDPIKIEDKGSRQLTTAFYEKYTYDVMDQFYKQDKLKQKGR